MNDTKLRDLSLEQLRDMSIIYDRKLIELRHSLSELERIFGDNETIAFYKHKIDITEQVHTQILTAILIVKVEMKINES